MRINNQKRRYLSRCKSLSTPRREIAVFVGILRVEERDVGKPDPRRRSGFDVQPLQVAVVARVPHEILVSPALRTTSPDYATDRANCATSNILLAPTEQSAAIAVGIVCRCFFSF